LSIFKPGVEEAVDVTGKEGYRWRVGT